MARRVPHPTRFSLGGRSVLTSYRRVGTLLPNHGSNPFEIAIDRVFRPPPPPTRKFHSFPTESLS